MTRTECPTEADLLAFHRGELPEPDLDTVAGHLAECPDCDARLTRIESSADPLDGALRGLKATLAGDPDPTDPALPERIGRYKVRGLLGRGGSGVVYEAWQPDLNRPVAVKVLRTGGAASADETARFRLEAEVLGRLRHPNLVQVFDAGAHDGLLFLVMEYVPGGSLDKLLKAGPLDPRAAAALVEPLAHAAHAAHQIGIVHRDIKPANVLLSDVRRATSDENRETADGDSSSLVAPKLTDFGLAKGSDSGSRLTESGVAAGTPHYMAPEQADAAFGEVGPAADVYGLGAVLYECLTGRPPFEGRSPVGVVRDVLTRDPVPPWRHNPRVPRDLDVICLKCLRKAPRDRYPSAANLADDLRRWRAGEPITARPLGPAGRVVKWGRRNPRLAAALAAVLVVLATGTGVSTYFAVQADARADDAADAAAQAQAAKTDAETARDASRAAQADSDRRAVELMLAAGQEEAAAGLVDRGLDRMIAALRTAPADDAPLRRLIRLNVAAWADRLPVLVRYERPSTAIWSVGFVGTNRDSFTDWPRGESVLTTTPPDGKAAARRFDAAVLAVANDGARVLVGDTRGPVRTVDVATGRPVGPPLAEAREIAAVGGAGGWRFGPDPDVAYFVTSDLPAGARSRAWDVRSGRPLGPAVVAGPLDDFRLLRTRDGRLLLISIPAADRDPLRCWDATTGGPLKAIPPLSADDQGVYTDGRTVGFESRWCFRWWDPATLAPARLTWVLSSAVPPWQHVGAHLSAGSDRVAAYGRGQRVWCYDVATQRQVGATVFAESGEIFPFLGLDGRLAAVGQYDGDPIRMWDPPAVAASPDGPAGPAPVGGFQTAVFAPDAGTAFVGDDRARDGRLVDAATSRPLGRPLTGPAGLAAFSPDGRRLATAADSVGGRYPTVQMWDAATGRPVGPDVPGQYVHALRFSPDGRTLAVGYVASLKLLDVATGRPRHEFPFTGPFAAIAFTADGRHLVTATKTGWDPRRPGLQFWDAETGRPAAEPVDMPDAPPLVLVPDPDGRTVWSYNPYSGLLQRWEAANGRQLGTGRTLHQEQQAAHVAFRPDAGRVAVALSVGVVRQWDTRTGQPAGPAMAALDRSVIALTYSPDGRFLAVGYTDGTARLWDADTAKPVGPSLCHRVLLLGLAFTPDGRELRVVLADGSVESWPVPGSAADDPDRLAAWLRAASGVRFAGEELIRLTPDEWAAERAEVGSWRPAPAPPADPYRANLAAARDAGRAGVPAAQLWHLDRATRLLSDDWYALALRGAVRQAAGEPERAAADFAAARSKGDAVLDWFAHAARDEARRDRPEAAVRYTDLLLATRPGDGGARLQRAAARAALGDDAAAVAELARARAGGAYEPAVLDQLTRWAAAGRWRLVADSCAAAPRSLHQLDLRYRQAVALLTAGDRDRYRTLCAGLDDDLGAKPGALDLALAAWTPALTADAVPDWSVPLGRIDRALAVLKGRPASEVGFLPLQSLAIRGALLHRAGRHREAVAALTAVIKSHPLQGGPEEWLFLAMAHAELGGVEEAERCLDRGAVAMDGAGAWEKAEWDLLLAEARAASTRQK